MLGWQRIPVQIDGVIYGSARIGTTRLSSEASDGKPKTSDGLRASRGIPECTVARWRPGVDHYYR